MTNIKSSELRWIQRFSNFRRAYALLDEVLSRDIESLNNLEQEGAIQRFEFTFELAWKVQKDLLEFNGIDIDSVTPRQVLKESFAAKFIVNGQLWIDMLDLRNRLSHTYDHQVFLLALHRIKNEFWSNFVQFNGFCESLINEN